MNKFFALTVVLLVFNSACSTDTATCSQHFAGGEAPVITKQSLSNKARPLCFEGYATLHSGVSRTPIWSAEHLTAERLAQAKTLQRKNTFHPEEQLPPDERSKLKDYVHSGYDRGHMAPSGDMPTDTAQHESFSLANMIPQDRKNNQILWEGIEAATRALAGSDSDLYVVTGPIFEGTSLERINSRVLVPTAVFKAIYDPKRNEAGAYVTPNAPGMEYQTLSIADLEKRIGINVFPKLPQQLKEAKMDLPKPTPRGSKRSKNIPVEAN